MACHNGAELSSHELLQAEGLIWNHLFSFISSFSLKCAIQLGIPDIIHTHGKPMPLPELVNALPVHKEKANCIYRLMRLLIHAGFFNETSEGYVLKPGAHLLLKENPFALTPLILSMLDPVLTEPWHQLSNWLSIDPPTTPFESFHGRAIWEFASNEPMFNQTFNEAMASDARFLSSVVLKDCKDVFKGVNTLVDVGGGTGTMAKAIADAFPDISCMVLDLPHVVDGLQGSSNLTFVAGDMFQFIPPADAILLKWILHDWPDDKCVELLKNCRDSILSKEGNAKVIILDMVIDKDREIADVETLLLFDILMIVLYNGKERTEKDLAKLFHDAGFTRYKISPVLGLRSLIELYP